MMTWSQRYDAEWEAFEAVRERSKGVVGETADIFRHVFLGGRGTYAEAKKRFESVHSDIIFDYVSDAVSEWRERHPAAPDWTLPLAEELKLPRDLVPGTQLRVYRYGELDFILQKYRSIKQPGCKWAGDGFIFPGAEWPRRASEFDIPPLAVDEEAAFGRWFTDHNRWREDKELLFAMSDRPIAPKPGLVWRQHEVREADVPDLRAVKPGQEFTIPRPMACRSIPEPIGGINKPLPRRPEILAGKPDKVIYLEIYCHRGRPLPRRPGSSQFESEVLLPGDSNFKVIRHIDLPYKVYPEGSPYTSTHGLQVVQI